MVIKTKNQPYEIPRYSLTGDLLSFLECEVQYRYNSKGSMPPSTPVQKWFGDFIHGVMEVAYTEWKEGRLDIDNMDFEETQRIAKIVAERLENQGLKPYRGLYIKEDTPKKKRRECNANMIAFYSLQHWAPHLYPLINDNEVKMEDLRPMLGFGAGLSKSEFYAVQGVVDVISTFDVSKFQANNPLVKVLMLNETVSNLIEKENEYEIIIDYKGMERPSTTSKIWEHHEWQLNTYMWLRAQQLKAEGKKTPILAGVLLYLNELYLSDEAMGRLQEIVAKGETDIMPKDADLKRLERKDRFNESFRVERCIRVVAYDPSRIETSLVNFDNVVKDIESNLVSESMNSSDIWKHWEGNHDKARCVACDLKTFCPYAKEGNYSIQVP
jgi:CRISPR/Cas system-associated exonuclease Cas4 (RecB family)